MANLTGKRVAFLVDDYFEQAGFTIPRAALIKAGASVDLVTTKMGEVPALHHFKPGDVFQADRLIDDVRIDEYDALILPGGALCADRLRMNDKVQLWVKKFAHMGRPIAAVCHAPWTLISAGVTKNRTLTSYFTLQDDLRNAGAIWLNQEVVIDRNFITGRGPDDIPAFGDALVRELHTR